MLNNSPFRQTNKCQRSVEYIKQVITNNPILIYPDPNKQYYLFTDSSKWSWSGILIQYSEKTKDDGTKIKIPHPITYQRGTSQGFQKNWSTLNKETTAIYMSFQKWYFTSRKHMQWSKVIMLPGKFVYSVTKNDKVNNWSQKMHTITPHIEFEHIKGKNNVLADSLSKLRHLGLQDDNDPEETG